MPGGAPLQTRVEVDMEDGALAATEIAIRGVDAAR